MPSISFIRSRLMTTSSSAGTAPPARPVSPPCTVIFRPSSLHWRTIAAISETERGRCTVDGVPRVRPLQSVRYLGSISMSNSRLRRGRGTGCTDLGRSIETAEPFDHRPLVRLCESVDLFGIADLSQPGLHPA